MTTRDRTDTPAPPAHGAERHGVRSEFERQLREPGCPTCRGLAEAERSFFSWLRIESFSVPEVQARLRAGMGMCEVHSRRLVEEFGEGHVMTIIMREAIAGARQRLRDEGEPGPCPACDAVGFGGQRARRLVVDGLADPATARVYADHDGVCLAHFLHAVPNVDASTLGLMAKRLLASLRAPDSSARVVLLAGEDPDVDRRARWRERLPVRMTTDPTVEGLCDRLAVEACPVCLSAGLAERGYLRWFLKRAIDGDPSLDNDPGELCRAHLHDLAHADRPLAAVAIEHKRAARANQLQRMLSRLAELPPPGRRGRRTCVGLDAVRAEVITAPYCPACNAREGIERTQLELLGAALALTPVRDRYEHSHGLCVRHALQLPDGQSGRLARRHADARLGVLGWEVHETARKYAWAFRHETTGPERDGWVRALAQIDGRVFEGGPAPGERGPGSGERAAASEEQP
jgi:hypothetical protein